MLTILVIPPCFLCVWKVLNRKFPYIDKVVLALGDFNVFRAQFPFILSGCEIKLCNSQSASHFWRTSNRNYHWLEPTNTLFVTKHIHLAKLAKWLSCVVSTHLYGTFDCMLSTIECGFTLKRVLDMIKTYSQMHHANKYSQHNSIIWPVWLNGWVFGYEQL